MKSTIICTLYMITMVCGLVSLAPETYAVEKPGTGYALVEKCPETGCGFPEFIKLVNRFINLLLYFAFLLAIISFIYAGFLLIFSGGNEGKVSEAKSIFWKVLSGIVLAFLAWTIVHFILGLFGVSDNYTLLQ